MKNISKNFLTYSLFCLAALMLPASGSNFGYNPWGKSDYTFHRYLNTYDDFWVYLIAVLLIFAIIQTALTRATDKIEEGEKIWEHPIKTFLFWTIIFYIIGVPLTVALVGVVDGVELVQFLGPILGIIVAPLLVFLLYTLPVILYKYLHKTKFGKRFRGIIIVTSMMVIVLSVINVLF